MPKTPTPLITVIPWKRNKLSIYDTDALFYLERDDWNDQYYYTSYHLHASKLITGDKPPLMIGHVKILKEGQKESQKFLLPLGALEYLDEQWCSMGTSLDYYERIAELPKETSEKLLIALRDMVVNEEIRDQFRDEPGYETSILRFIKEDDELFSLAPLMIARDYHKLLDLDLAFEFSIPEIDHPVRFNFDSKKYGDTELSLPNRIVAIIGRNGSGKSTLLSRISRVAFSSATVRRDIYLQQVGVIDPPGLGFPRIIVLSYSAFDAFNTPGIYLADKETIVEEMKNGLGRYVFCGVRDIVSELEEMIPEMNANDTDGKLSRREILRDKIENTKLKTIVQLGQEFVKNIRVIDDVDRNKILNKAFTILREEPSMHSLLKEDFFENSDESNLRFFLGLSTGHKFVIHSITSIITYGAVRSLLLFDEPETHLHPPILAALMKAIRYVLGKINAFMIVATHSPVVLQETLREHVYVVRRVDQEMRIDRPDIETFGENIGTLTQMAFGLTAESTDFHNTLDSLYNEILEEYSKDPEPEQLLERIESYFELGMSTQARSYLLSKIFKRG